MLPLQGYFDNDDSSELVQTNPAPTIKILTWREACEEAAAAREEAAAARTRRVSFGPPMVIKVDCNRCEVSDTWYNANELSEQFNSDLDKASNYRLPAAEQRGLERYLCAERMAFSQAYAKGVLSASVTLRGARHTEGKKANVEESLQQFAVQHSKTNMSIALATGQKDEREAMRIHSVHQEGGCGAWETAQECARMFLECRAH